MDRIENLGKEAEEAASFVGIRVQDLLELINYHNGPARGFGATGESLGQLCDQAVVASRCQAVPV